MLGYNSLGPLSKQLFKNKGPEDLGAIQAFG
jgi:hypothetical protein